MWGEEEDSTRTGLATFEEVIERTQRSLVQGVWLRVGRRTLHRSGLASRRKQ